MRSKRLWAGLLVAAMGIALLAGCAQKPADGGGTDAPEGEPIWVLSKKTTTSDFAQGSPSVEERILDEHGNVTSMVITLEDFQQTVTNTLDENGYVTEAAISDGSGDGAITTYEIEADENGRLTSRKYDNVSETYIYDEQGNLAVCVSKGTYELTEADTGGEPMTGSWECHVLFDEQGFVTEIRDEREDVTSVTAYEYELNEQGRPVSCTYTNAIEGAEEDPASVKVEYTYDANGNLASERVASPAGNTTVEYEYTKVSDPSPAASFYARSLWL